MTYSETDIIKGIKRGDDKAYRLLFSTYYHRLFCIARQYYPDDFVADTIVGDVIFYLWENRDTLTINTSINAYLIRSVRNYAINYLLHKQTEREVSLSHFNETNAHQALFLSDDYPLGTLIEKELTATVLKEIENLPDETRQVFKLSRMEELTYDEIALRQNISVNTVKYHIKQALSILRKRLKDLLIWIISLSSFYL